MSALPELPFDRLLFELALLLFDRLEDHDDLEVIED